MLRNRFTLLGLLLLLSVFTTAAIAAPQRGKGKGGGGGEDPPPPPEVELPPIEYVPTFLPTFANSVSMKVNDLNDFGMACGWYKNIEGVQNAWVYDGENLQDLNDLQLEGLEAGWIISSAVGMNNNGLIVGYASPFGDLTLRRGFILDLLTNIVYEIPDQEFIDPFGYARKVNDNGDVLLSLDNTPYLYNLGLRSGAAYPLEFISNDPAIAANLRNSPSSTAAEVVGSVGNGTSGMIWRYKQGAEYASRTVGDSSLSVEINSLGDIASTAYVNEEVQVRKNKTQTVTKTYLYREIGDVDSYDVEVTGGALVDGFNDLGIVLLTGGGGQPALFADGWGLVDLHSLINPDWGLEMSGGLELNNNGPGGFGQIAGKISGTESIVILTAYETESP